MRDIYGLPPKEQSSHTNGRPIQRIAAIAQCPGHSPHPASNVGASRQSWPFACLRDAIDDICALLHEYIPDPRLRTLPFCERELFDRPRFLSDPGAILVFRDMRTPRGHPRTLGSRHPLCQARGSRNPKNQCLGRR